MNTPNLFDFASGELSQDAFICWLAKWADPSHKEQHGALHETATAFLNDLMKVGGVEQVGEIRSLKVRRQEKKIDVLILVNDEIAIVIEDKTKGEDPVRKLEKNKTIVAKDYPDYTIAAVYLKTGDQCDYESPKMAGYGCFLRRDFLGILDLGKSKGVRHDVFLDFARYLEGLDQAVKSFPTLPLRQWESEQWRGFFIVLSEFFNEAEWKGDGHPGGTSLVFRWHWRGEAFLRLHGHKLTFRIEVPDGFQRKAKRDEWIARLMANNGREGLQLEPAGGKVGRRMAVAVLKDGYLQTNEHGLLDMDRTVEILRKAERLLDAS